MKKIYSSLFIGSLICLAGSAFAQTSSFSYTGAVQYYTVPTSITAVGIDMAGAQGGTSSGSALGGLGGRVQATLAVSGGQVLNLYIGGTGTNGGTGGSMAGGYNGGGNGYSDGGGGGGMTDIRVAAGAFSSTNEYLVAAGGGGGGDNY